MTLKAIAIRSYLTAFLSVLLFLAGCSNATAVKAPFETDGFILSAHRGATVAAPENTLEAVRAAIDLGYGAVEVDLRRSADGTIYLMHDDDVSRTTDGQGAIEGLTDLQISELEIDCSSYPDLNEASLRVPTFESVVEAVAPSSLLLNVDCSKGDWTDVAYIDQVIAILDKYQMRDRAFFVISDETARAILVGRYPDVCVSWICDNEQSINNAIAESRQYSRSLLSIPDSCMSGQVVEKLNGANIYYQVYSVEDQDRLRILTGEKVPMVETNSLVPQ